VRIEIQKYDELYSLSRTDRAIGLGYRLRRTIDFSVLRLVTRRLTLGSTSWHLIQHRLSLLSSLDCDWQIRSWFYEQTLDSCGSGLCMFPHSVIYYPRNVTIGDNVFINRNVFITCPAQVTIGSHTLIGPNVTINSGNHRYDDASVPIRHQGHHLSPISIGNDVWLGGGVAVLAGATIGDGAVVAAGAVVTGDVDPMSVVGGTPARPIAPPRTIRAIKASGCVYK
jgi:acetyltransferase-like isoleucine patch superfamily enzyme